MEPVNPVEQTELAPAAQPVPGGPAEDIHPLLAAALAPVLRDVCTTTAAAPQLRSEPNGPEWPHLAGAYLFGPWGMASVQIDVEHGELDDQIVQLADKVQDLVIEGLWPHRPTNWPTCPLHPTSHPMAPELVAGRPSWSCPALHRAIVDIGSVSGHS